VISYSFFPPEGGLGAAHNERVADIDGYYSGVNRQQMVAQRDVGVVSFCLFIHPCDLVAISKPLKSKSF